MSQELLNRVQTYLDKPLTEISRIEKINHNDFYNQHFKKNKPVVITKMVKDWEASKIWSLDYFKRIGKDKNIFIAKGNNFQENTKWEQGNFVDFIDRIEKHKDGESTDYLMDISIKKYFPELKKHIDFSLISNHTVRNYNAIWIGLKGTITGWHTDRLANNILAQIKGKKVVFLVSPEQSKYMYKSKKYEPGSLLSNIDMENFDENKFSLYKKHANVSYAIIDENEMLFIPQKWWHCVYGVEFSISTQNFGFSFIDNIRMKSHEFLRRNLHKIGFYGKNYVRTYTE
jgi:lysine-specific demethylase 8